jgi:hypothetical protein
MLTDFHIWRNARFELSVPLNEASEKLIRQYCRLRDLSGQIGKCLELTDMWRLAGETWPPR